MNKKMLIAGEDMHTVESKIQLTDVQQKAQEEFINTFTKNPNITEALKNIGQARELLPEFDKLEGRASTTMPVAYQIASLSVTSQEGHLLRGGSDGNYLWLMQNYTINQGVMSSYLNQIMEDLIQSGKLGLKELRDHFIESGLFDPNDLAIVIVGLEAYFKKDFVGTLHILIPKFEGVFLKISQDAGIDIVKVDEKAGISTSVKTLSERHLDSEEFVSLWGKDFCKQIKFLLFDPLGYKLRHKVAHGEITALECNVTNANLILKLYLDLISRVHITKEPLKADAQDKTTRKDQGSS